MDMTKFELVRAAFELFRLYGVKAISMDDLCRELRVSKKTLYRYFDDKEKLLSECVRYRISQMDLFKTLDDYLLDVLLACYEAYPKEYCRIDRRFCHEIKKYYRCVYDFMVEFIAGYAVNCGRKVGRDIACGYVRKGVSDRLVYLFLRECFLKLVSSEGDGDIDEGTYAEMILTFAHGISTLKGGAYINRKLKERRYNETY